MKLRYVYFTIGILLFGTICVGLWFFMNLSRFDSLFESKLQQEMVSFVFKEMNLLLFATVALIGFCCALALFQIILSCKEKSLGRMPIVGILLSISLFIAGVFTFFHWNTFQDIQSYRQGELITKEVRIAECTKKEVARYDKDRHFARAKPAYYEFTTEENEVFMNYHSCLGMNKGMKYRLTLLPKNDYVLNAAPLQE